MQFPVLQRCWGIGEEMLHLGGTAWQASLPLFWTRLEFLELLGLFDGGAMPVQSWTQILLKDLQLFRSAQRFEQSFSPAHFVLDKEHIILGVLQSQTWNFSTIKKKKKREEEVPFLAGNPQATAGSVVFCMAHSQPQRDCKSNSSISFPLTSEKLSALSWDEDFSL